jgi:integrase
VVTGIRVVPACPELVALLRHHLDTYPVRPGRPSARGARRPPAPAAAGHVGGGGIGVQLREHLAQRPRRAFTAPEAASPLARRPYNLRHTAVSLWLNAGVPAAQVAEWPGHSVAVLLRVYAKCIAGQEDSARDRISTALGEAAR